MIPIVVDSMAVVVISVGGCGWEKYKKLSEDSRFSSISQWLSHEGRVSVVLRGYNLINKLPASIV